MTFTVRAMLPDELETVAGLIDRINRSPEHHICYFDEGIPAIITQQRGLTPPPEDTFVVAVRDGRIVGALGADTDEDVNRAWLHGPIVDDPDWHTCADALYQALVPRIPANISQYEVCFDSRHRYCADFGTRHGFKSFNNNASAVLMFNRDQVAVLPKVSLETITERWFSAFCELHELLFPRTYYTGSTIIERINEHSQVFVITDGDQLAGYVYAQVKPDAGEGYIDFLGVDQKHRQRGYGLQLLTGVMNWIFSFAFVDSVGLSVTTTNETAIRLYQRTGFTYERTIVGLRT